MKSMVEEYTTYIEQTKLQSYILCKRWIKNWIPYFWKKDEDQERLKEKSPWWKTEPSFYEVDIESEGVHSDND